MNLLRDKLYQFRLRYTFDGNEKTVWTPISKVPLPITVVSESYTYEPSEDIMCNEIEIKFNTQDPEITAIDIAVRVGNDGQWALIDTIQKYDQNWDILVASNIEYIYVWKNDTILYALDQEDCARPFDYVPQVAECAEVVEENQLVFANFTEGYDNAGVDCQLSVQRSPVTGYEDVQRPTTEYTDDTIIIQFYEIPVYSTAKVYVNEMYTDNSGTETLVREINVEEYRDSIKSDIEVVQSLANKLVERNVPAVATGMTLTMPISDLENYRYDAVAYVSVWYQVHKSYKHGRKEKFKIVYYDGAMRSGFANGDIEVITPSINELHGGIEIPAGNTFDKLDIAYKLNSVPPKWAKYWQFIKAEYYDNYLLMAVDEYSNKDEFSYIKFNGAIERFNTRFKTSQISEWVYEKGDRLKVIGYAEVNKSFNSYNIFKDAVDLPIVEYNVDTKEFVTDVNTLFEKENRRYLIEVSRPILSLPENSGNLTYFEIGEINPILNAYTDDRSHGHINPLYTNQVVINGSNSLSASGYIEAHDAYVKRRAVPISTDVIWTVPVVDSSFSDFYKSDVHNKGRINVVDANARRVKLTSGLRWGGSLVQQSRINNLSRFDYADFDYVTEKYGAITRLKQVGEVLQCRQQYRSTSIYVGRVELRQSAINEQGFVAVSERLLGTRYVSKEKWGCVNPESEVQSGQISYYFDLNNGAIIADGYNKPQPISDMGLRNYVRSLAETLKGKSNVRVVGEYDRNDLLWYTFTADDFTPVTLVWKEGWKCFVELPEVDCYSCIGDTFLAFKDGKVYKMNTGAYNTWFGEFKPSVVNVVFNANPDQNKIFRRLRIHSDSLWTAGAYGDLLIQPSPTFAQGMQTKMPIIGLTDEEGMCYGDVPRNAGFPPTLQRWVNGEPMRGTSMRVRLTNAETKQVSLFSVGCVEQPT